MSWSVPFAVCLLVGMVVAIEAGRWIGRRQTTADLVGPKGIRAGVGVVEGATFALLGLLITFTFSGAAARFDARRDLVIHETNAIGTAWMRLDLLPADAQPALRDLFRRYVELRLATYDAVGDKALAEAGEALDETVRLQGLIWSRVVEALRGPDAPGSAAVVILPALNQMFDLMNTRKLVTRVHPPWVIFIMLVTLALLAALMAGHAMAMGARQSWLHVLALALIISGTIYVIVDLEFPRAGLIRVDAFDKVLVDLRAQMN